MEIFTKTSQTKDTLLPDGSGRDSRFEATVNHSGWADIFWDGVSICEMHCQNLG
jgi:hypothetical protein